MQIKPVKKMINLRKILNALNMKLRNSNSDQFLKLFHQFKNVPLNFQILMLMNLKKISRKLKILLMNHAMNVINQNILPMIFLVISNALNMKLRNSNSDQFLKLFHQFKNVPLNFQILMLMNLKKISRKLKMKTINLRKILNALNMRSKFLNVDQFQKVPHLLLNVLLKHHQLLMLIH